MHRLTAIHAPSKESIVNTLSHLMSMDVIDSKENWKFSFDTAEENNSDKELTDITIQLPNGTIWRGTIQCFMSIPTVACNALTILKEDAQIGFTDPEDQQNIEDSIKELQTLLAHFITPGQEPVSEMASIQLLGNHLIQTSRQLHTLSSNLAGGSEQREELQRAVDCISDSMTHIKKTLSLML